MKPIQCVVLESFDVDVFNPKERVYDEIRIEAGTTVLAELYLDKKPNIYIHLEDGRSGSKTFNDVKDLQRAIKAVESKVKGSVEKAVFERIGRDWIDVTELEDITDRKYLVHIIRKLVLKGYIEYKRGRRNKLYVKRKEV